MATRESYEADLREHLASCRKREPIPPRDSLGSLEEMQCRVVGGHLIQWLREWGQRLLRERAAFSALQHTDPDPVVCFQSDWPGLVAAEEILQDDPGPLVWGLETDFESFAVPDEEFLYHVELRSWFSPVDAFVLSEEVRERHPLAGSEAYWFHEEESVLGPLFARGARHLWKWDGVELMLLEEAVETWVS